MLRRPGSAPGWAAALAVASISVQIAVSLAIGLPEPRIHDEQSLLLQADTFLQGRLANPSPSRWRHFETFHVLVQPTYASKYPPAPAAALALGTLLGHPIVGVWLAGAAFLVAAAWMLHACLPTLWARLGALLLATNLVVATDWSHGYRGPFVAAAGGALLLGAAERLGRRPRALHGAVLGLAAAVLAASRPYEGLVLSAAVLVHLLALAKHRPTWLRTALGGAVPAALLTLAGGLGWLAFYQWRVTGDPLRVPFVEYDERYARVPLFLWQNLREPPPTNPRMEAFYRDFEAAAWRRQHTVAGWLAAAKEETRAVLLVHLGLPWLVALLALPWALRSPGVRRASRLALALLASQLLIVPGTPRYVAPGSVLLAWLAIEAWRRLRLWRPRLSGAKGWAPGRALAAALPFVALAAIPGRIAELRREPWAWEHRRAWLEQRLETLGGRQLVVVSYDARSTTHAEWVWNEADLATAPVLWARSLSPEEDCALMRSRPERRAWRLEVADEVTPPRLAPFAPAGCSLATLTTPPRTAPASPPPATAP